MYKLRSSTRGATELHLLDAHPTAYVVRRATILKKRMKVSQQKTRRLRKKVNTLASVMSELRKKNMINSDCATMLEQLSVEFLGKL